MTRAATAPAATRPEPLSTAYISTPFARRLRADVEEAVAEGCGFVVVARSGAGKSTELARLRADHPPVRSPDGRTSAPILRGAVLGGKRSPKGIATSIAASLGTVPPGSLESLQTWIAGQVVMCGTRLLVIDDAHGASPDDLLVVKGIVDEVRSLAEHHRFGFVLLCAGTAGAAPLQEIVNRPTLQWVQFRRRLSPVEPWRYVASLSEDEIAEVLGSYETHILADVLPGVRLVRWTRRIHRHLLHPFFDEERDGRATMQNVRNIVDRVARSLIAAGLDDVPEDGAVIDAVVAALLASPTTMIVTGEPRSATGTVEW